MKPDGAGRQLPAILVDDRHVLTRRRQAHRAGLDLHVERVVIADRQPELGGAEMIHRRHAPDPLEELHHLAVQRLAAARDRPQRRRRQSRDRLPSAIRLRSTVGVVARLLTRWRTSISRQTSGVAFASTQSTDAPIVSAGR